MVERKLNYEEKFEEVVQALKHSPEEFTKVLETTGEIAHAASDMTKDELALVSAYVKSDFKEFIDNYFAEDKLSGNNDSDSNPESLEDLENKESPFLIMIQDSIWQALLDITDRTKIEWLELFEDIEHQGVYRKGEVIGLGHLVCEKCGHKTQYTHPTIIEPCCHCGCAEFSRIALTP